MSNMFIIIFGICFFIYWGLSSWECIITHYNPSKLNLYSLSYDFINQLENIFGQEN